MWLVFHNVVLFLGVMFSTLIPNLMPAWLFNAFLRVRETKTYLFGNGRTDRSLLPPLQMQSREYYMPATARGRGSGRAGGARFTGNYPECDSLDAAPHLQER